MGIRMDSRHMIYYKEKFKLLFTQDSLPIDKVSRRNICQSKMFLIKYM